VKDQGGAIAAGRAYLSLVPAQMPLAAYTDFIGGTKRCVHARRVAQPGLLGCKLQNAELSEPPAHKSANRGRCVDLDAASKLNPEPNTANALASANVRHRQR